jgi:DNA-binding winged helix-turn-helix (wHTH) protein/Tol biopolymer transport system component
MTNCMRWKIQNYIFCEKQQSLTSAEQNLTQRQQLEPMVVELLAFFCRHQDQIISRDELIDQVWLGRMITDNAVSKLITKLRKIFNDDVKQPKFITTFPKKGYKFIAEVSEINEQENNLESLDVTSESDSKITLAANTADDRSVSSSMKKPGIINPLIILLGIVLVGITFIFIQDKEPSTITNVKALTRSAGQDSNPKLSPDGRYLSYMELTDGKIKLRIKSLADESTVEISHGEQVSAGPSSWNSDGSAIVYLIANSKICQYFIREINGLILGEPELIHNCPAGSYGKILFTHNDQHLIYTEADDLSSPYSLFELDLVDGTKRRLNQPVQYFNGNSQFDLHPTENKLLISSPDKQVWEGYYSLDLKTDELKLLFKQDAYICCGIWDHSGERVVLMGDHPAYQLVSYNLQGKDKRVVYSGSQQLRLPQRHINGKDYLFVAGYANLNALYYDFEKNNHLLVANTSVDDKLATFAFNRDQIAYIGLSTSNEEVWLSDPEGRDLKKLTVLKNGIHFVDLLWSYDGNNLLGRGLNEIYLIDSRNGKSRTLKISQGEIRGLSWKNNQTISYSIKSQDGWRVNYYDIKTDQVSLENKKWSLIQFAENDNDILWQDSSGNLYSGRVQNKVKDKEILAASFLNRGIFNLKKMGDIWAWQQSEGSKYQLMLKTTPNQSAKPLFTTDSNHFALSEKGLLYHLVENLNANIYQTMNE